MGKINQKDLEHLVLQKRITAEQAQQTIKARESYVSISKNIPLLNTVLGAERATNSVISARIALMRIGNSIASAFSSIINPTSLLMLGGTAIFSAIEEANAATEKIKSDASQLATDMKDEWSDIQKFISDHPIEIAIKGGTDATKQYIQQYSDELRKVLPDELASSQISSIQFGNNGKQLSLNEQLSKAKKLLEDAQQAKAIIEENSRAMADAASSTTNLFGFGGVLGNFNDFADEYSNLYKELANVNKKDILNTVSGEGLNPTAKWFRDNTDAAREYTKAIKENVSTAKLLTMAKSYYKRTDIETPNGKYMEENFLNDLGFGTDVTNTSSRMNNNYTDALSSIGNMVEQFK